MTATDGDEWMTIKPLPVTEQPVSLLRKKAEFADRIIDLFFEGECGDLPGDQVQDIAVETGVLIEEEYQLEKHAGTIASEEYFEPGDPVYFRAKE